MGAYDLNILLMIIGLAMLFGSLAVLAALLVYRHYGSWDDE